MNTTEKLLLVILVILAVVYLFSFFNKKRYINNDGSVTVPAQVENMDVQVINNDEIQYAPEDGMRAADGYIRNYGYAVPEGGYIVSNYADGKRGNQFNNMEVDQYFDENNNVIRNPFTTNPEVTGLDETQGKYNTFIPNGATCSSNDNQNCDPADLYNIDNYLPQQKIPSFFEVDAEPIPVKDRNLVNISRTLGINNTLSNTKNQSYDVRGGINNPRYAVSPWNQSTIEPGDDYKPLN